MAYNLLIKGWVGEQLRLGDGALVSSGQDVRYFFYIFVTYEQGVHLRISSLSLAKNVIFCQM